MESNRAKLLVAIGSIALIVVLFVVLSGGDDESTPTTAETPATTTTPPEADNGSEPANKPEGGSDVPAIVVSGGEPEGGVTELEFDKGDEIRFSVESDVAEEVHVHGYEVEQELEPGKPVEFDFPAEIEGVFEVELHESGALVAELTVNP